MTNLRVLSEFQRDDSVHGYHTVVGHLTHIGICTAWLEVEDQFDHLLVELKSGEQVEIFKSKYMQSPQFAAGQLLFAAGCKKEEDWPLYAAQWRDGQFSYTRISQLQGRVLSIQGELNLGEGKGWIVYENRIGKKTSIYAAYYDGTEWLSDLPVTSGTYNAYDPQIAVSEDGLVYCVYTAFVSGNYHILLQKMDPQGQCLGEPIRLDDQGGINYWPSLAPRKGGGVWVSWAAFGDLYANGPNYVGRTYLQHSVYKLRQQAFKSIPVLHAGAFIGDGWFAPNAPRNVAERQGLVAGFVVGDSQYGKQSQIFQMDDGSVHLVYRKYGSVTEQQSLCITSLMEDGWSDCRVIMPQILHEEPVSVCFDQNQMIIGITKDNRKTGWNVDGERFDSQHTLQVMQMVLQSERPGYPKNKFEQHAISPFPGESIEEDSYEEPRTMEKLVWGQTHCHSNLSVCLRSMDQNLHFNYRYFQDVQRLEFGTVTDHDYNMWNLEKHIMHKTADYYYFKGEFIAFPAYEWTGSKATHEGGPFGHVNVLCLEEEGELEVYTPFEINGEGSTLNKLWNAYRGRQIITIPHHSADFAHYYNWDFYNEEFVPVVEIFQDHRGQHEQYLAPGDTRFKKQESQSGYIVNALHRGYFLGFIGAGDHLGIAIAGVSVKELSRKALYEAFNKRNTYASTGSKAFIQFQANGRPAGSIVECNDSIFELLVYSSKPVLEVQIVQNGETKNKLSGKDKHFYTKFTADRETKCDFLYARIILNNGEVFWTSPIWLKSKD